MSNKLKKIHPDVSLQGACDPSIKDDYLPHFVTRTMVATRKIERGCWTYGTWKFSRETLCMRRPNHLYGRKIKANRFITFFCVSKNIQERVDSKYCRRKYDGFQSSDQNTVRKSGLGACAITWLVALSIGDGCWGSYVSRPKAAYFVPTARQVFGGQQHFSKEFIDSITHVDERAI